MHKLPRTISNFVPDHLYLRIQKGGKKSGPQFSYSGPYKKKFVSNTFRQSMYSEVL